MKYRVVVAAGVAAAMFAAAGCGGDSANDESKDAAKPAAIKVWLQTDAETGWKDVVTATNDEFKKQTGIDVTVEYQQWSDHLTKFDAALAAGQAPDVIELGNTETTKYLAQGIFADLTGQKESFPNSSTWSPGLVESCTFEGKLSCVPYYGGARVVQYNKDLFAKAGITDPQPKSMDELFQIADKVKAANPKANVFHMPGKYWYAAMSFVKDYGGEIAAQDGDKWQGKLDSPQAQEGITKWKELIDKYSGGDKAGTENNQYQTFAKGNVAMMYGLGWEAAAAADPKAQGNPKLKGKIGMFPMPSHNAGQSMPAFLGGSDLGIPAKSKNLQWAVEWLKVFTNNKNQTALATKGNIPNTSSLVDQVPAESKPIADAAKSSWFTPVAAGWATVESQNVLPNALADIASGKASVTDGLKKANDQITQTLQSGA